jgi:hypothetical protein
MVFVLLLAVLSNHHPQKIQPLIAMHNDFKAEVQDDTPGTQTCQKLLKDDVSKKLATLI